MNPEIKPTFSDLVAALMWLSIQAAMVALFIWSINPDWQ